MKAKDRSHPAKKMVHVGVIHLVIKLMQLKFLFEVVGTNAQLTVNVNVSSLFPSSPPHLNLNPKPNYTPEFGENNLWWD